MGILDCMCRLTGLRVVRPVQACRRALRCSLSVAVQRVQGKGSLRPLPAHTLDATGGILYNINVAQGTNPAWDYVWWQRLTLWSIVVLCGMTFSQGSNYLKWGLGLLGAGTAISLCTYIFTPQHPIYFGIFTFLGLAYLVVQPIHWWLQKSPGSCGWLLSAIAYDLTRHLTDGVIIWQGKIIGHLPSFLYGDWNVWLGLPGADFVSLEYVPFLPNIFLFLCGLYLFQFMSEHEKGQAYLKKLS